MRTLLFASLFITSQVLAGPFESFMGSYRPVNRPQIIKENITYCNWFNIVLMQKLIIDQGNGYEGLKLISTTNGGASTQHSMMNFVEYSHTDIQYPRVATLGGDENHATYTIENWADDYHFSMQKTGANFLFELTYNNRSGGRFGSCHYKVELEKLN